MHKTVSNLGSFKSVDKCHRFGQKYAFSNLYIKVIDSIKNFRIEKNMHFQICT